jgi:hypothetical protein
MCLQDVELGLRRYWRTTPCVVATVNIPGDARRVGIRIATNTTGAAETTAQLVLTGNNTGIPIAFVNQGNPTDELWLDREGLIVQQPLTIASSGNCMITEFLDNAPAGPTD